MLQEVNRVMQQTKRYWYEDGLAEIAAGVLFFVGAFILVVSSALIFPAVSEAPVTVVVVAVLILAVIFFFFSRIEKRINHTIQTIKEHVTYPRTGYVEYPTPEKSHRSPITGIVITFFLAGAAAAVLAVILNTVSSVVRLADWVLTMPMTEGIMTGVLLIILGYRVGVPRFYLMAVFAALAGAACAMQYGEDIMGTAIYFGVMAVVLMISGGIALVMYLKRPATTVQ